LEPKEVEGLGEEMLKERMTSKRVRERNAAATTLGAQGVAERAQCQQ
jgi:hypothetical protein